MCKRFQLSLILLLAAALWLGGLFWFVRDAATMAPPEAPAPLDAVVVLTGGTNRIETGFRLFKEGRGRKLFISGVYRGVEVRGVLRLLSEDIDDNDVALGEAENTMQNARETAEWMKDEGFGTLYLVTSNYHMRRALLEFSAAAPGLDPVPWPVIPQKLSMNGWWQDGGGLILREYCKYLLVLLRTAIMRPL